MSKPDIQPNRINDVEDIYVRPFFAKPNVSSRCLSVVPLKLKEANAFVVKHHRHHGKVVGYQFALGIKYENKIIGVAICGRPIGRFLDDGKKIEVLRLCIVEGIKNGCSKLYAACSRVAKEMGFLKIITYTLQSESGVSLKASGWQLEEENVGGKEWNSSVGISRTSEVSDLFGTVRKYPNEKKKRWSKSFYNGC